MHVIHTAGAPPSNGVSIFATMGSTQKRSVAPANSVIPKQASVAWPASPLVLGVSSGAVIAGSGRSSTLRTVSSRSASTRARMGRNARQARARWLTAFFSLSVSSAIVLPSPSTTKSGS